MVSLFSESYNKYYYAPWLSMPTCVVIFCIIGVILVPFFIQFGRINFWGESDFYFEQPKVSTTDHYIIDIIDSGTSTTYSSLSYLQLNKLNSFASYSGGTTYDGKNDKINLEATLIGNKFDYLRIMLFLDYEIKKEIQQKIWVMASVELGPLKNVKTINIKGNLLLHHNKPFDYPEASTMEEYYDIYFDRNLEKDVEKIFDDFTINRNQVTKFDIHSEEYETGTADSIGINIEINIPKQQKIIYRRPAYINLKFRWIEYLALFIPIVFIVYSIISFMFRYQLVECSVISSIPKAMN